MDWNNIVLAVISALTGGALASFLTYKLGSRKQDESEFNTLVSEYKQMVLDYKTEVIELRKEVLEVRNLLAARDSEIIQLRNQLMIFESSNVDVPVPIWLKDIDGRMLFLNPEYERLLLNPIGKDTEDYIGKTDVEVWGEKIGKQFYNHDREVMRKKKPIEFIEEWTGPNNTMLTGKVIKYPRFLNKIVIGIGGIIIESSIIES